MVDLNEETKKFLNDPEEELERQGDDIRDIQRRVKALEESIDAIETLIVKALEQYIEKNKGIPQT